MIGDRETLDASECREASDLEASEPEPGLLLLFGAGRPATVCIPLVDGSIELGRDHTALVDCPDPRISRRHVQVRLEGERWAVTDLGSRNGAVVDGIPLDPGKTTRISQLLRIGESLLLPLRDLGPLRRLGVRVADGRVAGPTSLRIEQSASRAAQFGTTLHITGESGAGKEHLAQVFHAATPAKGPFQAVNCAAIPEGVAERLLFGTRRGAYSGADADADGYVQAAHGGTLFLDEIAELSLAVQSKLLRTLEGGEVLQLGASRSRKVDLRFCSATHVDLRARVAAGKFREDLYYRIATPSIVVPPLRERLVEIPWLLQIAVDRTTPGRTMHVSFVETCLLRPWPGNVRELLAEARAAAQRTDTSRIAAHHLAANAGAAMTSEWQPERPDRGGSPAASQMPPTRARLVGVLRGVEGNISAAARELGVHRTQLKRWLGRQGIDAASFVPVAKAPPGD